MSCQIKYQKIMEMVDGKYQEFDYFNGDLSVGDTFEVKYIYGEDNGGYFSINFSAGEDYMGPFSNSFTITFADFTSRRVSREYSFIDQVYPDPLFSDKDHPQNFLHWRPDTIRVGYIGSDIVTLKRYYKSDWMGMSTSQSALKNQPVRNHFYTFDCRHQTQDKLEDFFYSAIDLLDP